MRCLSCGQSGLSKAAVKCPYCGTTIDPRLSEPLSGGTRLDQGRYRIDRMLGRGGFGITYRAFDTRLSLNVVIKEFFPLKQATRINRTGHVAVQARRDDYDRALSQFLNEARILAKITQENVVRVFHCFESHNTAYIVMEMIEGRTLRELLYERPGHCFSTSEVEEIVAQLVIALEAIHSQGVLHLDISLDNVMRRDDGKIVLIDFGAARQFLQVEESCAQNGNQQRKHAYAAPEMAEKNVSPKSDLFELAMMTHELLTGALPPSVEHRIATKDLWRPKLSDGKWRRALTRALYLKPETRPLGVREWWTMYHQKGIVFGTRRDKLVLGPRRVLRSEVRRAGKD